MTKPKPKLTPRQIGANERADAMLMLYLAKALVVLRNRRSDRCAAVAALLARAYEMATPKMSGQNRARVFWEEA